jgi:hypothetical protein
LREALEAALAAAQLFPAALELSAPVRKHEPVSNVIKIIIGEIGAMGREIESHQGIG